MDAKRYRGAVQLNNRSQVPKVRVQIVYTFLLKMSMLRLGLPIVLPDSPSPLVRDQVIWNSSCASARVLVEDLQTPAIYPHESDSSPGRALATIGRALRQ